MAREFHTLLKKKSTRQRFYSSMNYLEYVELYGPPPPLIKPLPDPIDEMPELDLQQITNNEQMLQNINPLPPAIPYSLKMETILQIQGSQIFSQKIQQSPKIDFSIKSLPKTIQEQSKRIFLRHRSRSENSEYLIFNFLGRQNENGRKKTKFQ